jgi:hypothetical protein
MSVHLIRVPKPPSARPVDPDREPSRLLCRPDPDLARRFERAVAPLSPRIDTVLGPEVYGHPGALRRGLRPARLRYRRALRAATTRAAVVAHGDVRSCYGSIDPATLDRALRAIRADPRPVLTVLRTFEAAGIRGLPVGPAPSGTLVELLLSSVDAAIRAPSVRHLRWADDVTIVGEEAAVRRALSRFEEGLGAIGLRVAPEKTGIVTTPRARDRFPPSSMIDR